MRLPPLPPVSAYQAKEIVVFAVIDVGAALSADVVAPVARGLIVASQLTVWLIRSNRCGDLKYSSRQGD